MFIKIYWNDIILLLVVCVNKISVDETIVRTICKYCGWKKKMEVGMKKEKKLAVVWLKYLNRLRQVGRWLKASFYRVKNYAHDGCFVGTLVAHALFQHCVLFIEIFTLSQKLYFVLYIFSLYLYFNLITFTRRKQKKHENIYSYFIVQKFNRKPLQGRTSWHFMNVTFNVPS